MCFQEDMDQYTHPAGLSIPGVLKEPLVHRSSWLYDSPPEGQDMPAVLICRQWRPKLPTSRLDSHVAVHITDARLDGLLRVPNMDIDYALITTLVESWRPETHSFHLPHGEMTITLQDMEVLMGVPIDGKPMTGYSHILDWGELIAQALGHRPPNRAVGGWQSTAVLERARLKAKWLEEQFTNPLPNDATKLRVQQYACFYMLELLASKLFMDKFGERLFMIYLQFLHPISKANEYSWGSATLSWLYRHLCSASKSDAKQIGGACLLLQLWAFARFPHICPVMRHPQQALPLGPLAVRWARA